MAFQLENLIAYQKVVNLADEVCDHSGQCDRRFGFIADQLSRASLSISTIFAEGNG